MSLLSIDHQMADSTAPRHLMHEMLHAAFDAGQTVVLTIRGQEGPYQGHVQDLTESHLTLLCLSCCQHYLWCLSVIDIVTMALVLDTPGGACLDSSQSVSSYP